MEELAKFINSCDFATPLYFWIAGAVVLLLIFFPWVRKKKGLAIDLQYWKEKVAFKSKRVWVLSIPVIIASILMAGVFSNPEVTTRPITNIYGYPVMLVVDVSGSMGVGYSGMTPFGRSYEIFNDLIARRGDTNFGLLIFSTDIYVARYFINKNELFKDTLDNRKEISYLSIGTRISGALAKARQFLTDNINGGCKAIILISDMDTGHQEWRKIVEEMTQMSLEGITPYMITPYDADTITKMSESSGSRGGAGVDLSQVSELKIVAMDDKDGINQICEEISTMQMSLIREDEGLLKKSLIPFLIIPALGVISLCLILGETRFRKIP